MAYSDLHLMGTWAVAVAQALDSRGFDSTAVFAEADIDLGSTRDPNVRIPAEQMTRVYELAEEVTGDPSFGLSIAEHIHPTSLHALGYSLFASRTMESFCRRIVRYFRLVSTNAETDLQRTENAYRLTMVPTVGRMAYAPQDAWLATIMRFSRDIYRQDFAPSRVELRRPETGKVVDKFTEFFRAPISFGCDANVLEFSEQDMLAELPAANPELARQNDQLVLELLARLDRDDIITHVRAELVELLPPGNCTKERVAARLNMSERTLQNRLTEKGTSYRELLAEMRQELAEQYLRQGVHSVSDVAYLLGFSEISSFSRAFRTWTGVSASEYRSRYLSAQEGEEDAASEN